MTTQERDDMLLEMDNQIDDIMSSGQGVSEYHYLKIKELLDAHPDLTSEDKLEVFHNMYAQTDAYEFVTLEEVQRMLGVFGIPTFAFVLQAIPFVDK